MCGVYARRAAGFSRCLSVLFKSSLTPRGAIREKAVLTGTFCIFIILYDKKKKKLGEAHGLPLLRRAVIP